MNRIFVLVQVIKFRGTPTKANLVRIRIAASAPAGGEMFTVVCLLCVLFLGIASVRIPSLSVDRFLHIMTLNYIMLSSILSETP